MWPLCERKEEDEDISSGWCEGSKRPKQGHAHPVLEGRCPAGFTRFPASRWNGSLQKIKFCTNLPMMHWSELTEHTNGRNENLLTKHGQNKGNLFKGEHLESADLDMFPHNQKWQTHANTAALSETIVEELSLYFPSTFTESLTGFGTHLARRQFLERRTNWTETGPCLWTGFGRLFGSSFKHNVNVSFSCTTTIKTKHRERLRAGFLQFLPGYQQTGSGFTPSETKLSA